MTKKRYNLFAILLKKFIEIKTFVDGNWTEWSEWTPCTQTCGAQNQTQTRKCENPLPAHAGNNCSDTNTDTESRSCNLIECPIGISLFSNLIIPF